MIKRITVRIIVFVLAFLFAGSVFGQAKGKIIVVHPQKVVSRLQFAFDRLGESLRSKGYTVSFTSTRVGLRNSNEKYIVVGYSDDKLFEEERFKPSFDKQPGKEGFILERKDAKAIVLVGADQSGILYGCLELAAKVKAEGKLPASISMLEQPDMVLRGACIGMQKPYYLPGRTVYEYPYTPQTFPWFYDKKLWIQYLDSMVNNRMNSLYLWNGHPFASLVKLKDYPYAVEVDDATFKKNEEVFQFLTTEANKRGIWVIQMFYNIIVSKPFAEKHGIKTQDRERPIIPLIADYTRKSIAAFVEKYPNVGLMVCLGEAMEGTGHDDTEWFIKTIIPGVQDGLKSSGRNDEPPIVLRAHDTDAPAVMRAALPLYKNLYTEAKFNGEALTTYEPRGKWAELHQTLSRLGSMQIENVHILANLEPFRYGSPDFIQKSVKGMLNIMQGRGLHLYPQASYWDWPYSADSVRGKRLLQVERDWIWYAAWSRYAWKSERNREEEIGFWSKQLGDRYGCNIGQGKNILEAYEQSGEISPKILRRFGITDGNRQTMTLGMLMTQLINPYRYGLFTLLYESESPVGEMLVEYAEKEWKGEKHIGETPVQIIREIKQHADKAVAAIEAADRSVTRNKEEFARLKNDMYCYKAMADHYAQKAEAALHILRYKYSNDIKDLEKGLVYLEQSVSGYRKLVELTKGHYLYANSMQTQQRKIPIRGVNGTFKTWAEVLVPFENELSHFKHKIDSLKTNSSKAVTIVKLSNADIKFNGAINSFKVKQGQRVFSDSAFTISNYAAELEDLSGVSLPFAQQVAQGTELTFTTTKPVKILVGYFNSKDPVFLKAPELETNASANDYGQAEIKIANALVIKGMPPVNIHSYSFNAGTNTLKLAKGVCLIVGIIDGKENIRVYDAGLTDAGVKKEIDWLFE